MNILLIIALALIFLFLGGLAAHWKIVRKCESDGKITVFGTEYFLLKIIREDGAMETVCPPFADGVLGKIKSLPKADSDSKSFSFDGAIKKHDCVRCCREAGDVQRTMIVCGTCSNKRCPKAQDHRMKCTGSNDVGQVGVLSQDAGSAVYSQNISGNPLLNAALYADDSKSEQSAHASAGCQTNEHYSRSADTGHSSSGFDRFEGCSSLNYDSSSSSGGGGGGGGGGSE